MLTATGIGTLVENGKQIIEVDGKPYLLEKPIRGDFALIGCKQADYYGNLEYSLTAHNFNPIMALAGEVVIAEPHHIVPVGVISARQRQDAGRARHPSSGKGPVMEDKDIIAERVAQEIKPEMLVNLGIGLPSLVANFLPKDVHVFFQAENGVVGLGPRPPEGMEDEDLTDAGGGFVTAMPGAASIDSAMSFALIRGGHLDMTVLGGLQVDERGYLANWMVPGKMVPGMGGAMDLVAGAKSVIVAMVHTAKGAHKIVERCTLPLTATRRVSLIVTEMAVIKPTEAGLVLKERGPGCLGRGHRQGDRREADRRGRRAGDADRIASDSSGLGFRGCCRAAAGPASPFVPPAERRWPAARLAYGPGKRRPRTMESQYPSGVAAFSSAGVT